MKDDNIGDDIKHLFKLLCLNSEVQSSSIQETCTDTSDRATSLKSDVEVLRRRVTDADPCEMKF